MSSSPPDSPYASPRPLDEPPPPGLPTRLPAHEVRRGILTVLASGLAFAVTGLVLGLMIGALLPDYYYTVFPRRSSNFDPVQVGMGLGVTQGFAAGVVVGLFVVAVTAWRHKSVKA